MKLVFSQHIFKKNPKYQISSKSIQWELSFSMQTERQTNMIKLVVAFCSFMNAPKQYQTV
jgi:hypothetical protein